MENETKEDKNEIKENEIKENDIKENEMESEEAAGKDWRDSVYGNIKMSVKTLDIIIGSMLGFIVLVLLVGAIKNFL